MSTKNLRLHGAWKFGDCYVGPFVVLECIRKTAHDLDWSSHAALRDFHNVFHVSLLCNWLSNGVHVNIPPIKTDGKAEYKVTSSKHTVNVMVNCGA